MPEIQRIELERDNDAGVHEVKDRTRLEPAEREPPQPTGEKERPQHESDEDRKRREDFERATTPFPGG